MPKANPLISKLAAIYDLGEDDREAVVRLCDQVREVVARTDIVQDGDIPENLNVILEGWALRYKLLEDGSRQILGILVPGDFCTLAATVQRRMDHSVRTLTTCQIAKIPRDRLNSLILARPEVLRAFWWSTIVEKGLLRAWIANLGRRSAYGRIAHLLCELYERLEQVGLTGDGTFTLPLTQEDLGDAVGLTSVHTNRMLQQLRSEGIIRWQGKTLSVIDPVRLRSAAGFSSEYLKGKPKLRA